MKKDLQLLNQGSTETLSWRKFILNRALPHKRAQCWIICLGLLQLLYIFFMKIAYKISYSLQITLKALSYFGFLNKL